MSPATSTALRFEEQEPLPPSIIDGIPRQRPLRVGIISNPMSGQNRRRGLHLRVGELLQAHPQVPHLDARTPAAIGDAAVALLERQTEIVVVNGGDGTMQAVLTAVMRHATDRLPVFAVLAGGTTNSTAHNVGFGTKPFPAVQRLLVEAAHGRLAGSVEARAVLRADSDGDTHYAMMFGAGAVYHGILFYRRHILSRGVGELGPALAVGAFLGRVVSGAGRTLFPPLHAEVCIDGEEVAKDTYLGILASTISRQVMGITPYWGSGPGALRYSSLGYRPRHLSRALWPALRGQAGAYQRPELGYRSVNATEVILRIDSGFTLDGELFVSPTGSTTVTLNARQSCYFLRDRR